jgi:hypothetical protein
MQQISKRVMFSESCSKVSVLLRCGVSAGISKIIEDKTQVIYFSHRLGLIEAYLTVSRWNILFISHVKYICVNFDKRGLHGDCT